MREKNYDPSSAVLYYVKFMFIIALVKPDIYGLSTIMGVPIPPSSLVL